MNCMKKCTSWRDQPEQLAVMPKYQPFKELVEPVDQGRLVPEVT